MQVKVDIITGSLGSGKTTFINHMLENGELLKEKIVILECEFGNITIDTQNFADVDCTVIQIKEDESLTEPFLQELINVHSPSRIIIETNGLSKSETIIKLFNEPDIKEKCTIDMIVDLIDTSTYDEAIKNIDGVLSEQIENSELILLNNTSGFSKVKIKMIQKSISKINNSAEIQIINEQNSKTIIEHEIVNYVSLNESSNGIYGLFFAMIIIYLITTVVSSSFAAQLGLDSSKLQVLNTVFISILIQAFPFILIGVFVSSIIQVFVTTDTIIKIFPRKKGLGFIVAIFAGVFFPVCDCAIVPVASRLIRKGVPLPAAITFLLAAPIVNPIVIASTLYAFPGQPQIALTRIFLGVSVALIVGIVFMIFHKNNNILLDNEEESDCECCCCEEEEQQKRKESVFQRIEAIFKHASTEFFQIGKYLIIGAFLSSLVQTFVPKEILANIGGGNAVSLLIMMLSAFILSVCSTSDAFIAKTFVNRFPMSSVMGFMVLGPMIDTKNLLMLMGNFKKRFVFKLVALIFIVSYVLLTIASKFLY